MPKALTRFLRAVYLLICYWSNLTEEISLSRRGNFLGVSRSCNMKIFTWWYFILSRLRDLTSQLKKMKFRYAQSFTMCLLMKDNGGHKTQINLWLLIEFVLGLRELGCLFLVIDGNETLKRKWKVQWTILFASFL